MQPPGPPPKAPSPIYEALLRACQQMLRHREAFAKVTLERHILRRVDETTPNPALMGHLVSEALMSRLDRSLVASKNIYVADFDIPQIDLFYEMATAYPHIYLSHDIANLALASEMARLEAVSLLEIGIGKGTQVEQLLERLARDPRRLTRRVQLLAVDPDPANLQDATIRVRTLAARLPFEVDIKTRLGLVEQMSFDPFVGLIRRTGGELVINSAYTLHHILPTAGDDTVRTRVLRKLAALGPRLMTLIEPDSNHYEPRLTNRFHNCWTHFMAVFELIDEAPLEPAVKFSVKEKFFGREIRDMFGVSDAFRCERHETEDAWTLRLTRAGFEGVPTPPVVAVPQRCEVDSTDGVVRLGHRSTNLISVIMQRPVRGAGGKR